MSIVSPENGIYALMVATVLSGVDGEQVIRAARDLVLRDRVHDAAIVLDRFLLQSPGDRRVRRILTGLRKRFLLVDEENVLFDTKGMRYVEFHSDYNQIRFYSLIITQSLSAEFRFDRVMEQQVSEVVKNAIKHGNRGDVLKRVRIWYEFETRVRYIVEDEGIGMYNLDEWNAFNRRRRNALAKKDMEELLSLLTYKSDRSEEHDGGNSLFAGLEFWDEGMLYNAKKNKIVVVKNRL
jgi:serine/threonine-protein kinase RsbW